MTRERANKFIGKKVKLTFKDSWFNEATQSWVSDEEEYIGILNHCKHPTQKNLYQLDGDRWLPTKNACWSANRIKTIEEVLL